MLRIVTPVTRRLLLSGFRSSEFWQHDRIAYKINSLRSEYIAEIESLNSQVWNFR